VFDRIEVRRVRGQKEQRSACANDERVDVHAFVKGTLSITTTCISCKRGQSIEEGGLLVLVKRNDAVKVVPIRAAIHEGPGSMIAGPQPGHPLPFGGVGVTTCDGGHDPRFHRYRQTFATLLIALPQPQIRLAFLWVTLLVAETC
jgi:hypothetical protein